MQRNNYYDIVYCSFVKATVRGVYSDIQEEGEKDWDFSVRYKSM